MTTAPALQAKQEELRKHKIEDVLSHKLSERPQKEELVQQNILKGKTILTSII